MTKWCRRHPKLSSISSVLAIALLLTSIAGAAWYSREEQLAGKVAVEKAELAEDQLFAARSLLLMGGSGSSWESQGCKQAEEALSRYQVLSNERWFDMPAVRRLSNKRQKQLGKDVSEVLLLLALRQSKASREATDHFPSADKLQRIAIVSWQHLVGGEPPPPTERRSFLRNSCYERLGFDYCPRDPTAG